MNYSTTSEGGMSQNKRAQLIQKGVISVLKESSYLTLDELCHRMDTVAPEGITVDEMDVREAVWALVDSQVVILAPDLRIRLNRANARLYESAMRRFCGAKKRPGGM